MLTRRSLLMSGVAVAAFGGLAAVTGRRSPADAAEGKFEVTLSDAEWKKRLTAEQYAVLRQADTERPFTSPLLDEHRAGNFKCAGCDLPVYSSAAKFDSGTGWPSFFEALPDAIATSQDTSLFMARTEIHCRRCGGHLGHLFDDGPQPTGMRHCINGVALTFEPKASA